MSRYRHCGLVRAGLSQFPFPDHPVDELRPCQTPGSRFLRSTLSNRNSLHCFRLGDGLGLAILHLTIDVDMERYLIEQRLKPQVVEAEMSLIV